MKVLLNFAIVCAVLFFIPDTAFSAGEVGETGTTGMSFLRITPSAHIASLGGGSSAFLTGPSSVWSNPSLIAFQKERSVHFNHIEWVEGIRQEFASFSTNEKIGSLGLSVQLVDSGDIELRGDYPSPEPQGTYSIKNIAFSLSYAVKIIDNIAVGLTGKKIYEKVSMETAGGYAVDAGIYVKTPLDGLSIAAAMRNYGRMGKLKNDRSKLPSDIILGCLYQGIVPGIERSFLVVGDILLPKYGDSGARIGAELEAFEHFALRIGFRNDSDLENVSFGIGFKMGMFSTDVSYTPMEKGFENVLRFTLGITGF